MTTIVHLITGLETGGAERMLGRLVTGLDQERHRSVVVSMTGQGAVGPLLVSAGIELHTLDVRRGMADPRGLTRLTRILRRVRPEILQTWLYHADLLGVLAQLRGPPFALFWNIRCTESIGADRVRQLLSWCSTRTDGVVVNSLAGQRFHEQLGYRPRRWEHIPNGCDASLFQFDGRARVRLRRELGIPDGAVAIGLPARYHPMKDHGNFLAAAARLAAVRPEAVFLLIGPGIGSSNRALTETIEAHGLVNHVRLLGECDDMVSVYSALDIATLSSAFGEGWPNVLGEAMLCHVPCVATDCGDAAEILGPTGTIVPRRDPQALEAAWKALISMGPDARRSIGAEARNRIVCSYDLRAIVGRYDALYSEFFEEHCLYQGSALRRLGRSASAVLRRRSAHS
jgi:glycosyltransferase involved in cell wall biosynthesis